MRLDRQQHQPGVPLELRECQSACRAKPQACLREEEWRSAAPVGESRTSAPTWNRPGPAASPASWVCGPVEPSGAESRPVLRAQCLRGAWSELWWPGGGRDRPECRFRRAPPLSVFARPPDRRCGAHQQFAKLEPGDEAIRRLASGLAQLFQRFVHLKVNAESHAIQHANLRNVRFQFDGAAKLRDDAGALFRLEHARIPEHALHRLPRFHCPRR